MSEFEVVREVPMAATEAFARLTDWRRHGDHVPLTRIDVGENGFTARTGIGSFGFDDPMQVVAWDPPRHCRLEKRGRIVTGWAEIDVTPHDLGCRVRWREVAHWIGVPRALGGVEAAAGRMLFGRVIDGVLGTGDRT